MSQQVNVEDLEVFRLFRAALLKFAQTVERSLSSADSEIARTHSWLESEQSTYWQGQFRKRAEAAAKARDAVRQKKLFKDSTGHTPDAAEEEKTLARCLAAVQEAEQKIVAVRKWLPKLEKEADMYRGGVARLNGTVSVEVPKAVALLDRLAATLEQYVQVEAPSGAAPGSAAPNMPDESMSRGGAAAAEPPPVANNVPPPAADGNQLTAPVSAIDAPSQKEHRDVADGK